MKILVSILSVLAVLIIALVIAAPHIVFNFAFGVPSRTTEVPSYYVGTPRHQVSQAGLKIMKELPSEDAYIESRDGFKLHAYMFPAGNEPENPNDKSALAKDERKKFVIGMHGYMSYSRPEYAPFIEFYRAMGYNMLLPDDRAHRPSEGDYIGFGVLDRLDCVDWAKYLVETYGEDIEIILHGTSMGGATVVAASGESDLPSQVKGIISDCAYTSANDIIQYQFREMPQFIVKPLFGKVEKIAEKEAGFNFHEYTPIEQIKNAKVPMLFVQGESDTMVPPYMVDELYNACPTEKRILKVEKAGHGESIAFAPEEYYKNIMELFHIERP